MSAWVLPDHIADVLPQEAQLIEDHRRQLLDTARTYGYELVMPPLVEHIESLLTGSGEALDLQTFKLVDLLSGRTLGVRADTTQQVARIDAHLLNRQGVTRLCYCGPVLHTRPERPGASREPLQFGAELYGSHALEADSEILSLAIDALHAAEAAKGHPLVIDLADARIVPAILAQAPGHQADTHAIHAALITKNADALRLATGCLPAEVQQWLQALLGLYGDTGVLDSARQVLPPLEPIEKALAQLRWLADHVRTMDGSAEVLVDLADARGYAYYSGIRFAIYRAGCSDALVRGGRYDEVGAVFGRNRPAVGFSMDVKMLAELGQPRPPHPAIRAEWNAEPGWRTAVMELRRTGQTVCVVLPGQNSAVHAFCCDRQLVKADDMWQIRPLNA